MIFGTVRIPGRLTVNCSLFRWPRIMFVLFFGKNLSPLRWCIMVAMALSSKRWAPRHLSTRPLIAFGCNSGEERERGRCYGPPPARRWGETRCLVKTILTMTNPRFFFITMIKNDPTLGGRVARPLPPVSQLWGGAFQPEPETLWQILLQILWQIFWQIFWQILWQILLQGARYHCGVPPGPSNRACCFSRLGPCRASPPSQGRAWRGRPGQVSSE